MSDVLEAEQVWKPLVRACDDPAAAFQRNQGKWTETPARPKRQRPIADHQEAVAALVAMQAQARIEAAEPENPGCLKWRFKKYECPKCKQWVTRILHGGEWVFFNHLVRAGRPGSRLTSICDMSGLLVRDGTPSKEVW